MRLYNALTRTIEPLRTAQPGLLTWYACGPTVYDDAHLGHARSYICQDVLRRVLQRLPEGALRVRLVMNVTDVDDKILARAHERAMPWRQLARTYETRFLEDLTALGVELPTLMTRVSEFVPEIVAFVQRLQARGLAYADLDGSVYFDTRAFAGAHFRYGKLQPLRQRDQAAEDGGDGDDQQRRKRSPSDFALWKATRADDDGWPSPWGPRGRPGWHIECSAMASKLFGSQLDLHTGGIDLQFPHHDNEIAQCEAFHNTHDWCSHFNHTGHLHVKGLKMSKSLKNFTTIRDFLGVHHPRHFRLFCLQHHYASAIDYSPDRMHDVVSIDKRLESSLRFLDQHEHAAPISDWPARHINEALEIELLDRLHACHRAFWDHLQNDLNTTQALNVVLAFAATLNSHLALSGTTALAIRPLVARDLHRQLSGLLDAVGLTYDSTSRESHGTQSTGQLLHFAHLVAQHRAQLRLLARGAPTVASAEILRLCDDVRDHVLPAAGLQLEDRPDNAFSVYARGEVTTAVSTHDTTTDSAKQRERERTAEINLRRSTPPGQLFRSDPAYSAFDEDGLPTHDHEGKPLSASQAKKLAKKLAHHRQVHAKWQSEQKSSSSG